MVSAGLLAAVCGTGARGQAPSNAAGTAKPSQSQSAQQTPKRHSAQADDANPEGMPCTRILALSSTDYIAKTTAIDDSREDDQLRGIKKYGACYDMRTDALAATLARSGKGPAKAAREEFASLEKDIKDFTEKALVDVPSSHSDTNIVAADLSRSWRAPYAGLYQKAFRYEFYEEYAAKTAKPAKATATPAQSALKKPGATAPASQAASSASTAADAGAEGAPHEATAEERARSDADPVTQAKNKFGKILEAMPEDRVHAIHSAFSEVIGVHSMSEGMRLLVYRYAIYLLQSGGAKDAEPPLF